MSFIRFDRIAIFDSLFFAFLLIEQTRVFRWTGDERKRKSKTNSHTSCFNSSIRCDLGSECKRSAQYLLCESHSDSRSLSVHCKKMCTHFSLFAVESLFLLPSLLPLFSFCSVFSVAFTSRKKIYI